MQHTTNSKAATITTTVQAAPALHTVAAPATLRAQRVARVQVALHAKHIAAKQAKYQTITYATKLAAYNAAAAQLAASMGLPVPAPAVTRTSVNSTNAPKHAASGVTGACAVVRALAAANGYNRKATLAAAAAQGINPATAATQYAIAKKLQQQ